MYLKTSIYAHENKRDKTNVIHYTHILIFINVQLIGT